VVALVRQGHGREVLRALLVRLHSQSVAYGLRRDLDQPFTPPAAKIPLQVRPLRADEPLSFLDPAPGSDSGAEWIRRNQLRLLAAEIPTCWIATTASGEPCYMQWLIGPQANDRIRAQWGDLFPHLAPDEALLEGAYTPDSFRGLGIMPNAMARIAENARQLGARWVVTFVTPENTPSLKGCKRAGFHPYVERRVTRWLGRQRTTFAPLPEGFLLPYEREEGAASERGSRSVPTP
jgi:hypothetical protein